MGCVNAIEVAAVVELASTHLSLNAHQLSITISTMASRTPSADLERVLLLVFVALLGLILYFTFV